MGGEAEETEPARDVHLSLTPMQAPSAPQTLRTGPVHEKQGPGSGLGQGEAGLRAAERQGSRTSGSALLSWSSHPGGGGVSSSPAYTCCKRSPETTHTHKLQDKK